MQDTTVIALASDTLTLAPGWIGALIAAVSVALLVGLILVLLELRRVGNTLSTFLATTEERTRPLVEHANAAARNVEHITQVVRTDLDRINEAFTGLADGVGDASGELQKRLRDLLALLDLAQSEAEDAVLEAASKVRSFRSGMGLLRWPLPGSAPTNDPGTAESDGSGAAHGADGNPDDAEDAQPELPLRAARPGASPASARRGDNPAEEQPVE